MALSIENIAAHTIQLSIFAKSCQSTIQIFKYGFYILLHICLFSMYTYCCIIYLGQILASIKSHKAISPSRVLYFYIFVNVTCFTQQRKNKIYKSHTEKHTENV